MLEVPAINVNSLVVMATSRLPESTATYHVTSGKINSKDILLLKINILIFRHNINFSFKIAG
jgi:hypothetical protein